MKSKILLVGILLLLLSCNHHIYCQDSNAVRKLVDFDFSPFDKLPDQFKTDDKIIIDYFGKPNIVIREIAPLGKGTRDSIFYYDYKKFRFGYLYYVNSKEKKLVQFFMEGYSKQIDLPKEFYMGIPKAKLQQIFEDKFTLEFQNGNTSFTTSNSKGQKVNLNLWLLNGKLSSFSLEFDP